LGEGCEKLGHHGLQQYNREVTHSLAAVCGSKNSEAGFHRFHRQDVLFLISLRERKSSLFGFILFDTQ